MQCLIPMLMVTIILLSYDCYTMLTSTPASSSVFAT